MKSTAPADMFYTPAQIAELLQISPKAVIARVVEMEGVLVLPDAGKASAKSGRDTARFVSASRSWTASSKRTLTKDLRS
jgi:hypothetical protein